MGNKEGVTICSQKDRFCGVLQRWNIFFKWKALCGEKGFGWRVSGLFRFSGYFKEKIPSTLKLIEIAIVWAQDLSVLPIEEGSCAPCSGLSTQLLKLWKCIEYLWKAAPIVEIVLFFSEIPSHFKVLCKVLRVLFEITGAGSAGCFPSSTQGPALAVRNALLQACWDGWIFFSGFACNYGLFCLSSTVHKALIDDVWSLLVLLKQIPVSRSLSIIVFPWQLSCCRDQKILCRSLAWPSTQTKDQFPSQGTCSFWPQHASFLWVLRYCVWLKRNPL